MGCSGRGGADEEEEGVDLDGEALAGGVDLLLGAALDIDPVEGSVEEAGEVVAHDEFEVADLWALEDDGGVEVGDAPAGVGDAAVCIAEEGGGVAGVVVGVVVGEELADVGECECAEEGVGDGVVEGVAVGVGDGAAVVRNGDSGEEEGTAGAFGGLGFEAVDVVAEADAVGGVGWNRHGAWLR